ncbi:MAG: serine/threonine protein kinase [Candidatus Dormibacteria bacterium]
MQVDEKTGRSVGRYRVGSRIQALPYASIHRATVIGHDRHLLLWLFGEQYSQAAGFLEALQRLAGDVRAADIPGVIRVLEVEAVEEPGPLVYLATEDPGGGFLVGLLQSGCAPGVLATARSLAVAIDGLHGRGLVHGDVQPATIAVDGHEDALLVGHSVRTVVARVQPRAGWLELTRDFRPPESRQPLWPTRATDLYGLAAVTYYLLVGRPPASGGAVTPPGQLRPGLPGSVDAALVRALAPDPASRFATAGEFAEALRPVSHRSSGGGRPARPPNEAVPVAARPPGRVPKSPSAAERPEPAADGRQASGATTTALSLVPLESYEMRPRTRRRSGMLLLAGLVAVALILAVLAATGRISP